MVVPLCGTENVLLGHWGMQIVYRTHHIRAVVALHESVNAILIQQMLDIFSHIRYNHTTADEAVV